MMKCSSESSKKEEEYGDLHSPSFIFPNEERGTRSVGQIWVLTWYVLRDYVSRCPRPREREWTN